MKFRLALNAIAFVALTLFLTSMAQAQATRTWVSGVGDDANPCSRTAPCKTFAGAISKTADKGEINAIDPGGFGNVTIAKNITIDGGGTFASVLASGSANAVIVNDSTTAPGTVKAFIRNISIQGGGFGLSGVNFISGNMAVVENVTIVGFLTSGIRVNLSTPGQLKVINTTIDNCGADGIIASTTSPGELLITIENSRVMNNSDGMEFGSHVRGSVHNTIVTHNQTTGIKTTGTNSILNLDDVTVSYSTTALQASAGSTINLSDSIIAQAVTGLNANGGTINSFQGNSLINAPGVFAITTNKQ